MDYEKAYKAALERARELYNNPNSSSIGKAYLYTVFHELKESMDERIRNVIRGWIYTQPASFFDNGISKEEMLAWIEKQREKKSDKNIAEIWKDMRLEVYAQASGNRHEANYSDNTTKMFSLNDIDEIIEKISEQKVSYTTLVETGNGGINALVTRELSTNSCDDANYCSGYINKKGCINCENEDMKETEHKVKSKFKVGDWITFYGDKPFKILKVESEQNGILDYLLLSQNGHDSYYNKKYVDENARLWTIQGAKDGDVLASYHEQPFIYNGNYDSFCVGAHCGIDCFGAVFITDECDRDWTGNKDIHPATKEQRDLLFQKMREAGWEWDADKKELKKLK